MSPVRRSRIYKWELDPIRTRPATVRELWKRVTPPQLFIISFLGLIAFGTAGLMAFPVFYTARQPMNLADALFTATSAICVTGLIVVDTATHFTPLGKLWILMLMEVGGLGVITFTTVIIVAMGGRLSLRHEAMAAGARDVVPAIDYRELTRHVILFSLAFQAVGAVALWLLWIPRFGVLEALGHATFHSVSAFANAGFSTFSDSLKQFDDSPLTLGVLAILIVLGGIGFLTMEEAWQWVKARRSRRVYRMSLHSKIVLAMTALLIVVGWLTFILLEWNWALVGLDSADKVSNALFMSISARTAGYNSIDHIEATAGSNFMMILLMFVGGAPGSTAGGVKVTTVALPALMAWSRLRGRSVTSLWGRTIPEETIHRAVGLVVLGFALVTAGILLLVILERSDDGRFMHYMFEAVSAFNTVGLSLGVTPSLSQPGRLLAVALMFMGRVGLPTLAAALTVSAARRGGEVRYAREDVMVG